MPSRCPFMSDKPTSSSTIQGTTVRLETEEDIQKWIEERKRKWPGSKNAEILVCLSLIADFYILTFFTNVEGARGKATSL